MLNPNPDQQSGVLASLSPETLDKLADLVVAKLVARNDRSCFPSKTSWVRIPSPAPHAQGGGLLAKNEHPEFTRQVLAHRPVSGGE